MLDHVIFSSIEINTLMLMMMIMMMMVDVLDSGQGSISSTVFHCFSQQLPTA